MIQDTLKKRLELRASEKFVVESIMPAGELHLIGGASGAGKTTWMLQWLRDWEQAKPIFGHQSFPCPWVYISFDRGMLTLDRTLRRIRMDDWAFPAYSVEDLGLKELTIFKIVDRFPEAQLFVIEGFQSVLPDASKGRGQNKEEMLWATDVRKKILSTGKTILGVTHTPKMKMGESYQSTRSRFLGSNSLLASTGTLISFDIPEDSKQVGVQTDERTVLIEGPNFQRLLKTYTRDNYGRFVEVEEAMQSINLDTTIAVATPGTEYSTKDLEEIGAKNGMSRASVFRWIQRKKEEGLLVAASKGRYKKPDPS